MVEMYTHFVPSIGLKAGIDLHNSLDFTTNLVSINKGLLYVDSDFIQTVEIIS